MTDFDIIAEFRASGGRVGDSFQGSDILLLHDTGARSRVRGQGGAGPDPGGRA
jgi:hypothetical protein